MLIQPCWDTQNEMDNVAEQANAAEVTMGSQYGVPNKLDEAAIEAGLPPFIPTVPILPTTHVDLFFKIELEALSNHVEEGEEPGTYLEDVCT
jgi:hypothetical protein